VYQKEGPIERWGFLFGKVAKLLTDDRDFAMAKYRSCAFGEVRMSVGACTEHTEAKKAKGCYRIGCTKKRAPSKDGVFDCRNFACRKLNLETY